MYSTGSQMMTPIGFGQNGGGNDAIPNGGSDVAGNFNITMNARPNYAQIARNQQNKKPFFHNLRTDDRRHKNAHKGLLAFQIVPPHSSAFKESSSGWNMDYGTVSYIDNLNGMFSDTEDTLVHYAEFTRVLGIVKEDIIAEPFREDGHPLNNTLGLSGTDTIPNVGPYAIQAGQKVMWEFPTRTLDGKTNSSVDRIASMESGLAPLLTVPYIAAYHKGSPDMIYSAIDNTSNNMKNMNAHDTSAVAGDSKSILDSLKVLILVGLRELMLESDGNFDEGKFRKYAKDIEIGDYQSKISKRLVDKILKPFENYSFEKDKPTTAQIQDQSVFLYGNAVPRATGASLIPNDEPASALRVDSQDTAAQFNRNFNILQCRAFHNLYRGISNIENRFRDRIFGIAYTNASPGRDFDILLAMSGRGSL